MTGMLALIQKPEYPECLSAHLFFILKEPRGDEKGLDLPERSRNVAGTRVGGGSGGEGRERIQLRFVPVPIEWGRADLV